jgi:hypothetical protein
VLWWMLGDALSTITIRQDEHTLEISLAAEPMSALNLARIDEHSLDGLDQYAGRIMSAGTSRATSLSRTGLHRLIKTLAGP